MPFLVFLYTVGFCGQPTRSAVHKNGAVKLAEMRVNRTHPRRSARPATALKAARSTRNLFISICRLLQRSNQANILRNFRGGPTRRVMRLRKARKRGPGIDAAKAFVGRHRASCCPYRRELRAREWRTCAKRPWRLSNRWPTRAPSLRYGLARLRQAC